jgi:hypothetical protein
MAWIVGMIHGKVKNYSLCNVSRPTLMPSTPIQWIPGTPFSRATLGIDPATFRFVAQYLNHCTTACPMSWWQRSTLWCSWVRYCTVLFVGISVSKEQTTSIFRVNPADAGSILKHIHVQWHTEGRGLGGFNSPPPPKFRSFAKAEPNSQFCGIYIRNNLIRIWGSFICKLSGTPD